LFDIGIYVFYLIKPDEISFSSRLAAWFSTVPDSISHSLCWVARFMEITFVGDPASPTSLGDNPISFSDIRLILVFC